MVGTLAAITLLSQEKIPAFYEDVQKFVQADLAAPPAEGQILFVGSSSFTNWKNVGERFPGRPILNRAFGGSTLLHMIHYLEQVVSPYQAKQIVMYCGENDLAADPKVDGREVYHRFRRFFRAVKRVQPRVPFVYVAMKPSPSRWHLFAKMSDGNRRIKAYLQKWRRTAFVDVVPLMLGPDGKPRPEIFLDDKLHMNAAGYDIWQKALAPVLLKG